MSINRVLISGNLTRDPLLRSTAGGTAVLSFGVAVNDRRRNAQTGEWEDYANYVDCTMFGARAEAISKYLAKGNKVAIEGKLRWSQWERDGQKRSKLEVIVDEIELFSARNGGNGGGAPTQDYASNYGQSQDYGSAQGGYGSQPQGGGYSQQPSYEPMPSSAIPDAPDTSIYGDDIPF